MGTGRQGTESSGQPTWRPRGKASVTAHRSFLGGSAADLLAANALMSGKASPYPKKIRLKIAGKIYVATYDVQDDCVQVTLKGRRSIWTEVRGSRPEDVAKMLLRE